MRKQVLALAILALTVGTCAQAAVYPKGTKYDNRVRYVEYNPDDVVIIKSKLGYASVIQLESGENLNSAEGALAIGDKSGWEIGVRENNIVIKPIVAHGLFPKTNINVISNKRVYAFELVEAKTAKDVSYFVRFNYPEPPKPEPKPFKEPNLPCMDGETNHLYYKYGDEVLAPMQVWDDGKFTCFRYAHNKPIPAIYKYEPDSELGESLVNFNVVGDTIVVQTVANEFRLRFGDKVMGIKTDNLSGITFNKSRTATGEVREVQLNEQ